MTQAVPATMRQLRSTVKADGTVELALVQTDVPEPGPDEVLVRVEAAPINPSDLGVLLAGAELDSVRAEGSADAPRITARLPEGAVAALAGRVGHALPVGNEGAGVVVKAGAGAAAQGLVGRTVAVFGGAMYAEYRLARADQCLLLPEGTSPAEGASCFVNPLTALGMVETMRREGHRGLVHTAAASNLGQMLNRLCLADGVPLVNVVRRPEQEALLREQGASHVVDSSSATFLDDLTEAIAITGATLGFDAVGGGELAGRILGCMEAAVSRSEPGYNRYGSSTYKHVYIYGSLDRGPTVLHRRFGMAWGIGGWLLPPFLEKIGPDAAAALRERVAAEITTTFASHYHQQVSLAEAVSPEAIAVYGRQATGEKFLINPQK